MVHLEVGHMAVIMAAAQDEMMTMAVALVQKVVTPKLLEAEAAQHI